MIRFFVGRPIVAMVLSILLVIGGLVAAFGLPIAQYPEIVPPQIVVNASFVGADSVTVEQAVATPLEQQVNGVERMLYMQSTNGRDGSMSLRVSFDVDSEIDLDNILTQNRVSQAEPQLPADVRQRGLTILKAQASPLLLVGLASEDPTHDAEFLANFARINVVDELARVRGVGQIRVFGAGDYAMRLWLDPARLTSLGLTVADVRRAVQEQNVVTPGGQVGGAPAPTGQAFTYSARMQGRLETVEQFENVIVRARAGGAEVRLRDVARVELGTETYDVAARLDGSPSAILAIFQQPGTNALDTVEQIKATLERLKPRFPQGVKTIVSLDTTLPVRDGMHEILVTLVIALVLVILVVYVFLQSWRATLVPLVAVPVALVGTFALFPLFGFSINTLSLLGLVLAIGLVVDDAIVVVEAVERHIEKGQGPRAATLAAMEEVAAPIVSMTLILSAVFVPVAFVPGISGRLYQQFAITIAVSVLLSAVNALTLSPALAALLLRPRMHGPPGPVRRIGDAFNRLFERGTNAYLRVAGFFARRVVFALILLALTGAAAAILGLRLPSSLLPGEDLGYLFAEIRLPPASARERSEQAAREVEKQIRTIPGIAHVSSVVGFSMLSQIYSSNAVFFFIALEPWEHRSSPDLRADALAGRLTAAFRAVPAGQGFAFPPPAIPGLGTSGGFSLMLQDRGGHDPVWLAEQVKAFIAAASKRPELAGLRSTFDPGIPQLYLDVDREKALEQGVSLADLSLTLQTFLGGAYVNDFNRFGRQWRVYMQAEERYRASEQDLRSYHVRNAEDMMVPVASFVQARRSTGPDFTTRFNLYRSAEVNGQAAPGYSSGQALAALEEVARSVLPADMGFAWNAMSYQERNAPSALPVLGLSLLVVFLILAALYESWALPWSVLLATPAAALGTLGGLASRSFPNDVFAQVALIMLIGLSAKNSILIVEFAKAERDKGATPFDAALTAARLRLRPILMTSFAFILGAVPLWIAAGAGSIARREIGTAVVVGMSVATFVGVIVTPALFVFVESVVAFVRRPRRRPRVESHA